MSVMLENFADIYCENYFGSKIPRDLAKEISKFIDRNDNKLTKINKMTKISNELNNKIKRKLEFAFDDNYPGYNRFETIIRFNPSGYKIISKYIKIVNIIRKHMNFDPFDEHYDDFLSKIPWGSQYEPNF
jgi:hypothetical protein